MIRPELPPEGAPNRDAYIHNALVELAGARSYTFEVLTGPADEYLRENFLSCFSEVELNLRKALA